MHRVRRAGRTRPRPEDALARSPQEAACVRGSVNKRGALESPPLDDRRERGDNPLARLDDLRLDGVPPRTHAISRPSSDCTFVLNSSTPDKLHAPEITKQLQALISRFPVTIATKVFFRFSGAFTTKWTILDAWKAETKIIVVGASTSSSSSVQRVQGTDRSVRCAPRARSTSPPNQPATRRPRRRRWTGRSAERLITTLW